MTGGSIAHYSRRNHRVFRHYVLLAEENCQSIDRGRVPRRLSKSATRRRPRTG
ncbi:hypothetical protein T260_08430 [Geobacillus thermopakistaniensis]|uniref:Uncharacterized protein n=1 Tax=Geobacillus thermopakistaniensis (strain MAS1) TaxID=1408282 RepID=A0A7U9JBJ7_GEOTM|nr:hypothetical protein T260_08430 [Geobacillus sp. MAS1]